MISWPSPRSTNEVELPCAELDLNRSGRKGLRILCRQTKFFCIKLPAMPRQLPPLNALRSFEAAARYESFTRAAEELHVTQSAVSQQVKALEAQLGFKLFNR